MNLIFSFKLVVLQWLQIIIKRLWCRFCKSSISCFYMRLTPSQFQALYRISRSITNITMKLESISQHSFCYQNQYKYLIYIYIFISFKRSDLKTISTNIFRKKNLSATFLIEDDMLNAHWYTSHSVLKKI